MTDDQNTKHLSRRTMVKGAAWSVPVLATAVAVPMASASTANATLQWDGTTSTLANIGVLDGSGTVTASILPTFPNNVVLQNGAGAIAGPITGTISVTWASGLPVSLLSSKVAAGFGVSSLPGATLGARTVTPRTILNLGIATLGVEETSQPFTLDAASVASNAQEILGQAVFGITKRNSGVSLNVLMTFNVTVTLADSTGAAIGSPAVATISVPAGAGIL